MAFNWKFDTDLKLYRAGCGCRMMIENQDGSLVRRFVKVCKRHQEDVTYGRSE